MKKQLQVHKLNFSYNHNPILKDLSFEFERGKFYSIIGPNGSGKTTLLKLISNIYHPHHNTIYINGDDIRHTNTKKLAKTISLVPQMLNINYEFSVHDIIMMGRTPYLSRLKNPSKRDHVAVEHALSETKLWKLKDKKINRISGGELQRVIIARALAQETEIMLLDEPISHLDIQYQYDIIELIHKLCNEKKMTVVTVVHDLNIALRYSDRVILLNEGRVYKEGNPKEVLTKDHIKDVYNIDVEIIKHPHNTNKNVIIKI